MSALVGNRREKAPFRYDIVGSFLRTQEIKDARESFSKGNINNKELRKIENEEIEKLVEKQLEVGLEVVTDGEYRRSYWHLDFFWGIKGVKHNQAEHGYQFHELETRADSATLEGRLNYSYHPFVEDYKFLHKVVGGRAVVKQCIPAPAQLYLELIREKNEDDVNKFYPNREELFSDISRIYREIILDFYKAGCRNIQLDDCTWGAFCDQNLIKLIEESGTKISNLLELFIKLNNDAIVDLPSDLTVTTHVCRGNYRSTWAASGGYEPVAEVLFGKYNIGGYFLEFDNERSGDFQPLRYIPKDKIVVLGLFSSKTGELEEKDVILKRIEEVQEYVDLDNICLSPQCGFASTEEGNILTEKQQWDKLRFIKLIVDEIWK